jgi:methyl-accepting chemotaxis protein
MMALGKLTIKTRLSGGLGVIIAFITVLICIGIWSLQNINSKLEQIIKVNNAKIHLSQNIQNAVGTIDKSGLVVVIVNDPNTTKTEQSKIVEKEAPWNSLKKWKRPKKEGSSSATLKITLT